MTDHMNPLWPPPAAAGGIRAEVVAARLNRLGFTRGSGRRYLCLTGKFNDFARAGSVATAEQITELLISAS